MTMTKSVQEELAEAQYAMNRALARMEEQGEREGSAFYRRLKRSRDEVWQLRRIQDEALMD